MSLPQPVQNAGLQQHVYVIGKMLLAHTALVCSANIVHIIYVYGSSEVPVLVAMAVWFKAGICNCSLAGIVGSIPTRAMVMSVCL